MRVKDFTYYPIMNDDDCAFRIEGTGGKRGKRGTYHQCVRVGRVEIEGYRFCDIHAKTVRRGTNDTTE